MRMLSVSACLLSVALISGCAVHPSVPQKPEDFDTKPVLRFLVTSHEGLSALYERVRTQIQACWVKRRTMYWSGPPIPLGETYQVTALDAPAKTGQIIVGYRGDMDYLSMRFKFTELSNGATQVDVATRRGMEKEGVLIRDWIENGSTKCEQKP